MPLCIFIKTQDYFCHLMKRLFTLITVLITISLIGIIIIQYSWLKNIILIRQDQVVDRIQMAEYEVVEELVDEKLQSTPSLPEDVFPKGSMDEILKLFGPPTIAERFSVEDINKKFIAAFAANRLKGAQFQFAVISSKNDVGPELASPNYFEYYEAAQQDSMDYSIHVWPLVSLAENEQNTAHPQEKLVIVLYDMQNFVFKSVRWTIIAVVFFTLVIISAFYVTVRTIITQKKLSEMKTDFINNMTHELRTPLATIGIAVDTLRNEKVIGDREKLLAIGQVIKSENMRMNTQVEQILQAAQLDVSQVLKDKQDLYVHEVLMKIKEKFALQVEEKNAVLNFDLTATKDMVSGHPVHFMNMLSNLVDNSLKYCKEDVDPVIEIHTRNVKNKIVISFKDNGIGMNRETVSRVFDKFYRAHTGNIHNVKGFGLGLNYTKQMVEAHMGTIEVQSTPGVGSTFTVSIPLV